MIRPDTLHAVAAQSRTLEEFGRFLQDWLHSLRTVTSRPQLARAIAAPPPRLARRFAGGAVADAWLAAYAEWAALRLALPVPAWTSGRVAPEPWFGTGEEDTAARLEALRDAPGPFKARNLYVPQVELPLRLAAGRPAKSRAELAAANAARQRRFRLRRKAELRRLRHLAVAVS